MVYFSLTTEFMYYLLVTFTHMFSSTIMIIFLPDILVKTKYQNQFTINISGSASMLIYNNSTSPVSLVYDSSYNVTSPIDLSNNFLFLNGYGISFLQTLLRNFHHFPGLILSWSQSTSLLSKQFLSLSMIPSHLFVLHVFSKHSVSSHVISNRDSEFVSNFFQSLGTAFDMWLHFTLGYHPENDGQTEYMNQTLEQYLYVYCNYQQDNWSKLLSLTEFAYNNALSTTTGVSPFFANKGYHPNITVYLECDIAFS